MRQANLSIEIRCDFLSVSLGTPAVVTERVVVQIISRQHPALSVNDTSMCIGKRCSAAEPQPVCTVCMLHLTGFN